MDFFDFSKEARIKEEARIKALENNVINKATKMALDKFSKVYGGTTQVIAKTANLREFKRNYLSGKIASELCISTKQGTKNIPFTILVKASEPSILESDQIIFEKVASTEGSLDAEINNIIGRQEQKLANLEAEEQTNKKIIADLAKGVSLEASRKNHIFKEATKSKKKVERTSLSTATTPTDFLGDVVEYFTYPKTFFPAMKVGAIIDIAGVKYKYIGDEATMTEPAGNTNGTIARFELANKKKASLNKEAVLDVEALIAELYEEIKAMRGDWGGYDPLEYTVIEAKATADGRTIIQVRDELSYEGMVRLAERLNPIIQKVDPESYFEQVEPGIMEAYLGDGGTKTYASSKSNIEKEAVGRSKKYYGDIEDMGASQILDLLEDHIIERGDKEFEKAITTLLSKGWSDSLLEKVLDREDGEFFTAAVRDTLGKDDGYKSILNGVIKKEDVPTEDLKLFDEQVKQALDFGFGYELLAGKIINKEDELFNEAIKNAKENGRTEGLLTGHTITKDDGELFNQLLKEVMSADDYDSNVACSLLTEKVITKQDEIFETVLSKALEDADNLKTLIGEGVITREDSKLFGEGIGRELGKGKGKGLELLYNRSVTREDGKIFEKLVNEAIKDGYSRFLLDNEIITKEDKLYDDLVKEEIKKGNGEDLINRGVINDRELDKYREELAGDTTSESIPLGEEPQNATFSSEIPEEILNSVVGQQKGMSASEVWRQMGSELGYAGRSCIVVYQRLQKERGKDAPITFKDVYNSAKSKKEISKGKLDEEEKAYKQFITDDKAMLDYIGDAEDLKDTGTKLKKGEEVDLLVDRREFNSGLPENRVNDILVDIITGDPDASYKTLCFLFPDNIMSDEGTTYDDSSISDKYKKLLLESAASKYPGKVKRVFGSIAEKYLDSYREEKEYEEEQKYAPTIEGEFAYSIVEDFLSTRPSKEKLKKYLEKYNVMNNIDNEIKKI